MHRLADQLWQLKGFPRDMFNVYLAEDVLIDAGTKWATSRILRQLHHRPISMIALTHCHPDHQGTAHALCERYKVPLACHEADVPAMEGRVPMQPPNRVTRIAQRYWAGPPHRVGKILRDGDVVAGFRVIHAPGHTQGHVIYYRDCDRVAIAGDVLANIHFFTGKPGLREPPPFSSTDREQNRASIRMLVDLEPALVCFGHGPPCADPGLLKRFVDSRLA
jgi:hydroxyacylglutathione hydrolase